MNACLSIISIAGAAAIGLALTPGQPGNAATGVMYALSTVPLLDAPGGKSIGTIAPGSAVTVAASANGALTVSIAGFAPAGTSALLYSAVGQRIIVVSGLDSTAKRQSTGAAQHVGGTVWTPQQISGYVAAAGFGADVTPVWKGAQTLYGARCSTCHALPAVAAYSANAWPGMVRAMVHNAGLTAAQTSLITKYLQTSSVGKAG